MVGLKWHNKNIDKTINISDEAKVDTDWWLNNVDTACHNIIIHIWKARYGPAARINKQWDRYVFWKPEPHVIAANALMRFPSQGKITTFIYSLHSVFKVRYYPMQRGVSSLSKNRLFYCCCLELLGSALCNHPQ